MHPQASVNVEQDTASAPSTAAQTNMPRGRLATFCQRIYRSLGFQKGYNFALFVIFGAAMLGFTLARLSYLNVGGAAESSFASGASPGEWYWFKTGVYRVGITIHLGAILPAGLLMVWQFVPVIRHRLLLFHRINGYVVICLVLISHVGALIICRRSFGGTLDVQAGVGALVILTTTSISLAYYNIKRLQIDQHRAWMLRSAFYLGTIITLRLIMVISAAIITSLESYYATFSCDEVFSLYSSKAPVLAVFPQCAHPNTTADSLVAVLADLGSQRPEQVGASLQVSFGMAMWLAIVLHLVGVEIYLALTPRESHRLRQVSYERQLKGGFKNPGSAGLTSDRCGDAEAWKPIDSRVSDDGAN